MMRLFRYGDLAVGPIFQEYVLSRDHRRVLKRFPVRLLGFSFEMEPVQALFKTISIRKATPQKVAGKPGQKQRHRKENRFHAHSYLAVSLVSLRKEEMEAVLKDPACAGLWILMEDSACLPESLKKKTQSKVMKIFSVIQNWKPPASV